MADHSHSTKVNTIIYITSIENDGLNMSRRERLYIGGRMTSFEVPGSRPRGGPKRRLMDAVKEDVKVV